ncbi:histidine kinase dimerization/phosphoacceptor domain -containing protein [Flavobacterium aquidurense]|uniref:histidine kinase dimerization/phosphoacceptor domain -containing protein n=1 Tax=Flavobacterium aquidurense TaxID=362413 RepID=UPI00286034DD|nr:histidine kinase dimerization/phosphoacceptor domain -containing protein [Flavobacterium aquidurense]MDR7369901.1 two-component sensor histidine kinase [Flavobacterium aquidurense]
MKIIYFLGFLLSITLQSYSQIKKPVNSFDVKKERLLLKATGIYLHASYQGAIDIDSAMVMACKANNVPVSLSYDEGYNDGNYMPGSELVDNNNIKGALKILAKLQKTDRVKLLLHLGSHYLFKPGNKKEDLQKSVIYIKQAIQQSNLIGISKWQQQSNMLLAKYYSQANNLDESKRIFLKAVQEIRTLNQPEALAEALENEGTYLPLTDEDKAKSLSEAMVLYRTINEKEKELESLMKLITVHFWTGRMDLAEKENLKCLALQKKIGFKHNHYTTTTLAFIYIQTTEIGKALYYALESIKTMEATKDYICANQFYMRLGNIYNIMGHYEEAIKLYRKSIDADKKYNIKNENWYKSFFGAAESLFNNKKYTVALNYINAVSKDYPPENILDKMYLARIKAIANEKAGNQTLAEKFYLEMITYAKKLNSLETDYDVAECYSLMSLFYAEKGDLINAKFYADKIKAISKGKKQNFHFQNLELSLFKIDSLSGNYFPAIKHYQVYKQINDSLFSNYRSRQIEELKIQYEALKKEESIKSLGVQNSLQQNQLEKSKLIIKLSIGLLLLLLIIIVLLYNLYRLKQKNNKKLEIKEKEISLKNTNLQYLLNEKEWLIKEIHHRVKNNLQTVMSLLNSQSSYIENELALSTIKSSQHRIHAMSLIHQKLYMSENISTINIPVYIKELVEYLKDSFYLRQRIRFKIEIDQIELDVIQAIPLGLIINEAVTNSIKYAFPNDGKGIISITLTAINTKQYSLSIQDNGIGIPAEFKEKNNSFGMSLIKGLSTNLEGTFSIENSNGTLLKLNFEKVVLNKHKKF